jgi:hypothetical protein
LPSVPATFLKALLNALLTPERKSVPVVGTEDRAEKRLVKPIPVPVPVPVLVPLPVVEGTKALMGDTGRNARAETGVRWKVAAQVG